jgi:carboxyl-terminal processing protease
VYKRFILPSTVAAITAFIWSVCPLAYALSDKGYEALHNFAKVLHYIEENYVTEIDEQAMINGAINGMLDTLDTHSLYMTPEFYRELQVDTKGRFDGVGIEVSVRGGVLTIVSPIAGTPADEAGLRAGDRIVKINGKPTGGIKLAEAIKLMRGKRGSKVTLSVLRGDADAPIDFTITRQIIKVPSVKYELLGDIGHINIVNFQQDTERALSKAIKDLNKKLGKDRRISAIILDLRKNPGGLLNQAIAVSDVFLSKGTIVSTESRGREIERVEAHEKDTEFNYPMVVLIDGGSASASEIVAGALKDNGRATLLGEQTFGKGSVQTVIDLDDGSGLKLTIAYYHTPSGKIIHNIGIEPNIKVPHHEPENENDSPEEKARKKSVDYQLEMAVDYLKKKTNTLEKEKI